MGQKTGHTDGPWLATDLFFERTSNFIYSKYEGKILGRYGIQTTNSSESLNCTQHCLGRPHAGILVKRASSWCSSCESWVRQTALSEDAARLYTGQDEIVVNNWAIAEGSVTTVMRTEERFLSVLSCTWQRNPTKNSDLYANIVPLTRHWGHIVVFCYVVTRWHDFAGLTWQPLTDRSDYCDFHTPQSWVGLIHLFAPRPSSWCTSQNSLSQHQHPMVVEDLPRYSGPEHFTYGCCRKRILSTSERRFSLRILASLHDTVL